MTTSFAEAISALPDRTQTRLAGPIDAVGLPGEQLVRFAGHVLRLGERGLLVVTDRELLFATETGRLDRVPLERLTRAVPRDTMMTLAPGTGGRVEDEFRPLQPPTFAGVEWPRGITAVHPDAGPRAADRHAGRAIALLVAVLVLLAVAAAVVLLG